MFKGPSLEGTYNNTMNNRDAQKVCKHFTYQMYSNYGTGGRTRV